MKVRSSISQHDPLGWDYWAAVHGTDKAIPLELDAIYSQCDHSDIFLGGDYIAEHFFSWHRAYLYFFERALQSAAAETGFTGELYLPYRNWYQSGSLPTIFTEGDGTNNPLWHRRKNPACEAINWPGMPFRQGHDKNCWMIKCHSKMLAPM